ncbi:MAG: TldD/PmbA family protein, partial [Candidatus Thorarchaeota archaeon]
DKDFDMFGLANYGLSYLEKHIRDFKCAEFFLALNEYLNIEVDQNAIKHSETGNEGGLSVRIYDKKGALGFAFTNILTPKSIENIVITASKMMKVSSPDPDFIDLPLKTARYPNIQGIYDKEVENLAIEESIIYLDDLINECNKEESAISQSASFTSNNSKTLILNSNNLEVTGKETVFSLYSEITLMDNQTGEISNGFEYQLKRSIKEINGELIAKNAIINAKNNLNRTKIPSKNTSVILSPRATIDFILRPIAGAINAETFQYKRSFLLDKLGQKIGSSLLNIEDNALIDGAVGSSNHDDEGIPCKNKKIFMKGEFLTTGLLHNSYTAGKDGTESTGNATRTSYSSLPSIGITNFVMKSGTSSKDEIFEGLKEGIFIYHTADSPNISTGDFSGLITQGNVIENGEIGHPLNETMFGVNLLDIFQKISAVSKEYKIYGPYYAPYVMIDDVKIIGSAN